MPYVAVLPTQGRKTKAVAFSTREKVQMVARCKIKGEDPKVVVPPFYEKYGAKPPRHPAQSLSGFAQLIQKRLGRDDTEMVDLCKEFGIAMNPVEPQETILLGDPGQMAPSVAGRNTEKV